MYRLLLVEDELSTRKWLTNKVDWESFGFQLIGVAEDGEMAWAQIQKDRQIDVVMTDVRMPFMDGIELIQKIRHADLDMEVIISSGYGDFDYAQKAIRLGVAAYLLKPITKEQIKLEFESIKIALDEKHQKKHQLIEAVRIRNENQLMSKTEWFHRCLIIGEEPEGLESIDFNEQLLSGSYMAIIASIDHYNEFLQTYRLQDQRLCRFMVMNILTEIAHSHHLLEAVLLEENQYVFFVAVDRPVRSSSSYTYEVGEKFQQALSKYLKFYSVSISVGGSAPASGISGLVDAYKQAVHALEHKFFKGKASIISFSELAEWNSECHYSLEWEKKITLALKKSDFEHAYNLLDQFFKLYERRGVSSGVRWIASELLSNVTKQLSDLKSLDISSELMCKLQEELEQMETLEDIREKMKQLLSRIDRMLQKKSTVLTPVAKGVEYVKLNLNRDLSLQEVAEYAGISPSYFSTQFKQEQGRNFIDFMISMRMEKAQELLEKTQMTIMEIGEQIGYHNYRYFTKVFKNHVGLTPSQYRGKVFRKQVRITSKI